MKEQIMFLSSLLFGVLFSFLVFIFLVFIASIFFKKREKNFEPKVSIVIPTYNEEKNIKECIKSIFTSNYTMSKIEVIMVDDGSSDNTLNTIKDYKKVQVLSQKHLGKVEALNFGVANANNELIVTVDADTTLDKECIRELVKPFVDRNVGATTGNNVVKNKSSLIAVFQNVEYHHSNLIRNSFSKVFGNGIWFSGSIACYRKSALEEIGYFKRDTLAEDQDVALELKKADYKTINSSKAFGFTIVPCNLKELYQQRKRWWIGTLQSIVKNKKLLLKSLSPSIIFLFINQFWWSFYAFLSLPLILYQISYWLPYNTHSSFALFNYIFRWFSLIGPVYVLYKIPEFGVNAYTIFGVLSGVMTTVISVSALKMFKDKINFKNMFAIFFYFPYTIALNIMIIASLLRHRFWQKSFYIK